MRLIKSFLLIIILLSFFLIINSLPICNFSLILFIENINYFKLKMNILNDLILNIYYLFSHFHMIQGEIFDSSIHALTEVKTEEDIKKDTVLMCNGSENNENLNGHTQSNSSDGLENIRNANPNRDTQDNNVIDNTQNNTQNTIVNENPQDNAHSQNNILSVNPDGASAIQNNVGNGNSNNLNNSDENPDYDEDEDKADQLTIHVDDLKDNLSDTELNTGAIIDEMVKNSGIIKSDEMQDVQSNSNSLKRKRENDSDDEDSVSKKVNEGVKKEVVSAFRAMAG